MGFLCAGGADANGCPQISGRMENLLFGVRLAVVSSPLAPSDDLEALARSIDARRRERRHGGGGDTRT